MAANANEADDLGSLVDAARSLCEPGRRRILGITGPPGAGKSTLAEALVRALGPVAALVPMDGFHLPQVELVRRGRAERKGAPDTFDAASFAHTLGLLRNTGTTVHAPSFDRITDEPVADVIEIGPRVELVVTEGNYLLIDDGDWGAVREQLDACWYVELHDAIRRERLIARHVQFGRSPDAAAAWAGGTDEWNAVVVRATRPLAQRIVRMP